MGAELPGRHLGHAPTTHAFYWGETPAHKDYGARLSKYLKDEYPSSWAIRATSGMQFLVEAIKEKASSTGSDKVSKALLGLTVRDADRHRRPSGRRTTRPAAASSTAKTAMDPKCPFPIMKPVTYVDPTKFMD